MLRDYLQGLGHEVLLTLEPGGSRLGAELRRMLLSMENMDLSREAELFLYLADRAQHVRKVILPAIKTGKIVISDRFADSTVVYQGYGRGMDPEVLHEMNLLAVDGIWPDITYLLDLPPEIGLKRAVQRNTETNLTRAEGRFEAEAMDFHARVRRGYLDWASRNKERFVLVSALKDEAGVFAAIRYEIDCFLKKMKKID